MLLFYFQGFTGSAFSFSELTRIFHTDLLRKPGSQMDAALDSYFDLDSMYTYSPASKCSSALPHQPSRPPRHDQYEISGLIKSAALTCLANCSCFFEILELLLSSYGKK
ncbi:MAG: hypothetical protein K9M81_03170 [Chthoniobacterales bacterium]|nr:hypothetical protein [Chthoniobacterales bacterium]